MAYLHRLFIFKNLLSFDNADENYILLFAFLAIVLKMLLL